MYNFPKVNITYQGAPLTLKYFNDHPEIHGLYPSKEKFMNEIYIPLVKKAESNQIQYKIEISENGIDIQEFVHK